ncbi:MAG TPA: ATP-binding protein [Stenomitos sp.]
MDSSVFRTSPAALDELFQHLPAGACLLDRGLQIRYLNPEYARYLERYFGQDHTSAIGLDWPRLLRLDDQQVRQLRSVQRSNSGVRLHHQLLRHPRTDEPTYWDLIVTPCAGALRGHLLVLTVENTERIRSEQKAVSERLQMEAILANIAEGLIVADGTGRILRLNPTACELLEFDAEEVLGTRPSPPTGTFSRLDGEPVPEGATPLARALAGEIQRHVVLRYHGPTTERILSFSAAPIMNPQGEVQMAVAILQDLSELDEVQRAYAELQLLEQRKAEFLNAVSHELRTPLTAIIGYAEFLDEGIAGSLSEPQREFVAQILSGTDRLMRLINDLLDFARLEAGAFRLDIGAVEYGPLVERTVSSVEPLAMRKGLSLEVEVSPAIPDVTADPERIAQILLNLLSNAVKFTPEGGQVCVRAWIEGESVVTEVSDTGVGLSPEARDRIFSKFYRAPESSKTVPGTGLGLAITKGLVEAHGGSISVQSTPGVGSTFRFTLPVSGRTD